MTIILIIIINEINKHIHYFSIVYRPIYYHVESKAVLYVRIRKCYLHNLYITYKVLIQLVTIPLTLSVKKGGMQQILQVLQVFSWAIHDMFFKILGLMF